MRTDDDNYEGLSKDEFEEEDRSGSWPDEELGIFDDDDPAQRRRDPLRRTDQSRS